MIYMVGVKVETIRHVTVEATTIDEAEQLGLQEAMALVGGIDGTVLEVYSDPKQLIGEEERDYCVDCGCILTSHESETLCRSCEERED
jgi:hypothetical protein